MKNHQKILSIFFLFFITQNVCFAAGLNSSAVLQKFFGAMIGVVASLVAIFLGLKFYQKLVLQNNSKLDETDYNSTLTAPKDIKEAINQFLDKTEG